MRWVNLISRAAFRQDLLTQIEREKSRSRRYGICSSLVVFDFSMLSRPEKAAMILFECLAARIRDADSVGWLGDGKIGALLPATDFMGANKLVSDVVERTKRIAPILYSVRTFPDVDHSSISPRPNGSRPAAYQEPSPVQPSNHVTQPTERLSVREGKGA